MIMSLGSFSHKEGDWGIWTCEDGISMYTIVKDGIDGSIYDNWILRKRQVESMLEMGRDPAWIEAYERDKAEARTYTLTATKELKLNGTLVVLTRQTVLDSISTGLDEAKNRLIEEMEKIKLIKIGG